MRRPLAANHAWNANYKGAVMSLASKLVEAQILKASYLTANAAAWRRLDMIEASGIGQGSDVWKSAAREIANTADSIDQLDREILQLEEQLGERDAKRFEDDDKNMGYWQR